MPHHLHPMQASSLKLMGNFTIFGMLEVMCEVSNTAAPATDTLAPITPSQGWGTWTIVARLTSPTCNLETMHRLGLLRLVFTT
jgi:hypothetical protein